jgi:hypothetical protein
MAGPFDSSDLDEVLDTLAEIEDEDLDRIITGLRNIATRAATGQLDLNLTQVLTAAIAGSPDSADLIGACAFTLTEITEHNPSLDQVTEDARKEAISEAQQASSRLCDKYLRDPASRAIAALDH